MRSNRNPTSYPTPSRLNVWAVPRSRIQHCLSNRSVFMPEYTHGRGRFSIIGLREGGIYISTMPLFSDGGSDWASENYAVLSDCAAGIHCNTALHLPTRHCYAPWIFFLRLTSTGNTSNGLSVAKAPGGVWNSGHNQQLVSASTFTSSREIARRRRETGRWH